MSPCPLVNRLLFGMIFMKLLKYSIIQLNIRISKRDRKRWRAWVLTFWYAWRNSQNSPVSAAVIVTWNPIDYMHFCNLGLNVEFWCSVQIDFGIPWVHFRRKIDCCGLQGEVKGQKLDLPILWKCSRTSHTNLYWECISVLTFSMLGNMLLLL